MVSGEVNNNRVLVIRSGFLGDVLMTSASLRWIKQCLPDSKLTYVTWEVCKPLLELNPHIDKLFQPGRYMTAEYLPNVVDFRHEAKMPRFKGDDDPLTYWGEVHAMQARDVLGLECRSGDFLPEMYISSEDIVGTSKWDKYVVINVWSQNGLNWRLWDLDKWAELVKVLRKKGYKVVQVGGRTDPHVEGAIQLCGRMRLRQTVSVVNQADYVVAIDSLVAHMAHGRKFLVKDGNVEKLGDSNNCVLLSGPVPWQNVVPEGALCWPVSNYPDCGSPCGFSHARAAGREICEHGNSCMKSIEVEQVVECLK